MDCIVLAGGVPGPDDPLYALTGGRAKALLPMGGRTMLERVVDALQSCAEIEQVIVVGLGDDARQQFLRPVTHLPDHGGMISNVLAGIAALRQAKPAVRHVLLSSADIPLLDGQIVTDFLRRCQPLQKGIYYNFITREAMEARFPDSRRTFVKLKDAQIAGGDMTLIALQVADSNHELWQALTNARKAAWQLARVVGIGFLFKFLVRRIGLADIEAKAAELIGFPVQIILNPHAEIGMDADKPDQVQLLQAECARL